MKLKILYFLGALLLVVLFLERCAKDNNSGKFERPDWKLSYRPDTTCKSKDNRLPFLYVNNHTDSVIRFQVKALGDTLVQSFYLQPSSQSSAVYFPDRSTQQVTISINGHVIFIDDFRIYYCYNFKINVVDWFDGLDVLVDPMFDDGTSSGGGGSGGGGGDWDFDWD